VAKGNTQTFSATVTGTNSPSQEVTWSVANKNSAGTGISGGGILTVASDETAASLTVRAASVVDGTKSGTAAVSVVSGTKDITGFSINGIAGGIDSDQKTVTVTLPNGTPVTSLSPQIAHNGAGIRPASGTARDFGSPVTYTVTAEDNSTAEWRARVELRPLDTIAKIDAYLGSLSGGGSAASPVPLPVQLNLPDADQGWAAQLSKIQEKGKYVALDLSACAMAGTEFDPGGANTGERRIVSLVLPAPAESIKAGEQISPTFKNFTVLKSLGGANVTAVGGYAFYNCGALSTVDLPAATGVGNWAFEDCDALETVNLPALTSVGTGNFAGCSVLATVNLPAAASIGDGAFIDCSALAALNIPAVTNIGADVFGNTGGQAAPSVSGSGDSASGTFSKNVTIRTTASPAGYGDTWQTNFRKAFGVSSGPYTVNINLGFQTITQ
jgi:hypothetical protein